MSKRDFVTDYGGGNYGRRSCGKTFKSAESTRSMRCNDCRTLRYCTNKELHRATQPRCLACGGSLTETAASHDRHIGKPPPRPAPTGIKCKGCGRRHADLATHQAHLSKHQECRDYYRLYAVEEGLYDPESAPPTPKATPTRQAAPAIHRLPFYCSCVDWDEKDVATLNYLNTHEETIERLVFQLHVQSEARDELEAQLGYVTGRGPRPGLRMKHDPHVSYHRCAGVYFLRWSAIEYVFGTAEDLARVRALAQGET